MDKYYSAASGGFYDSKEYAPADAIVISDDEYMILRDGIYQEKAISVVNGTPVLVDCEISEEELCLAAKSKRDSLLSESDFYLMADYPISVDNLVIVKSYRQLLRDITKQPSFPKQIVWPALALA